MAWRRRPSPGEPLSLTAELISAMKFSKSVSYRNLEFGMSEAIIGAQRDDLPLTIALVLMTSLSRFPAYIVCGDQLMT